MHHNSFHPCYTSSKVAHPTATPTINSEVWKKEHKAAQWRVGVHEHLDMDGESESEGGGGEVKEEEEGVKVEEEEGAEVKAPRRLGS